MTLLSNHVARKASGKPFTEEEYAQVDKEVLLDTDAACQLRGRSKLPCAEQLLKHQGVGHADG